MEIASSTDTGALGIMHLKRYWHKAMAKRSGELPQDAYQDEWNLDVTLLSALGLGLEQTVKHLYQETPGFEAFEQWILQLNEGNNISGRIIQFNRLFEVQNGGDIHHEIKAVLSEEDLEHWDTNGYVIVRGSVSKEDCANTIDVICDFLGIRIDDPSSWYAPHPARQGIMVQLFQHPQLEKNRKSLRIQRAFEQLWGMQDCWCNTDRVSFNPPETNHWKFPGPRLHWDVSLQLPIPFGLQGLLYLSDTASNQGAFTLVPGFHRRIDAWINSIAHGVDPRKEDLYALGAEPVIANAGDFIIWHQALPHGSSPNTSSRPRFVQYINYLPVSAGVQEKWM